MDYYNKYFKYKTKYLNLKYNNKQYGGTGNIDIVNSFSGIEITAVEVIFILGDKTGKDLTGKIDEKMNALGDLKTYNDQKSLFVIECIQNISQPLKTHLTNLAQPLESTSEQNNPILINLLEKFIDRYSGIKGELDITTEFNKLFNEIQLMLT